MAQEELERLGVPLVPAVALGERFIHGWQPAALAALLGVPYNGDQELDPAELAKRLDRFLNAAQSVISQVPEPRLEMKTPGRDRAFRDLTYHVFRLSNAFLDCLSQGYLSEAWMQEQVPSHMHNAAQVVEYGAKARARLTVWFKTASPDVYKDSVKTYYGDQSVHALLERTTWHAAQHLRQLYTLLNMMKITPDQPLNASDFEGLPLPGSLW